MRMFTLSALSILPAVLIAQAPAGISQQLRTEQPVIDRMVKELKAKEALVKAQALISGEKPVYNNTDLNTVRQSQYAMRDLMIAHLLAARTAYAAGEWEKGVEILQKGVDVAKENKAAFIAGAQPTLENWKKPEADAKAFLAEKPARMKEIEENIAKVTAECANVEAVKKLSKADRKALVERQTKAQAEAEELEQLKAAQPTHEDNLVRVEKIRAVVADSVKICDEDIATVTTALEKSQARIKKQADEIQDFNAKLLANKKKKVVIKGSSNWVDAVMNDQENFTRIGTPEVQCGFLNRLLVLDPGNTKAQKALSNIQAGKAPFEADAAAKGKAKKTR